jgi:hypothetical protein
MHNIRWRIPVAVWLAIGAAVPANGARRFVITSFGTVGDGKTSNTPAIQSSIDKVAKEGGGTAVVPGGTFRTGALFLKQGVKRASARASGEPSIDGGLAPPGPFA